MSSFKDLDLSSVEFSTHAQVLKPGRHEVSVTWAEWYETKSGGSAVKYTLGNDDGVISGMINVVNSNPKAESIGRETLKKLLTFGGHPNPNKPGDISTMRGLKLGVSVSLDKYTDRDGVERDGSKVSGFFKLGTTPVGNVSSGDATGAPSSEQDLDDDVPF